MYEYKLLLVIHLLGILLRLVGLYRETLSELTPVKSAKFYFQLKLQFQNQSSHTDTQLPSKCQLGNT